MLNKIPVPWLSAPNTPASWWLRSWSNVIQKPPSIRKINFFSSLGLYFDLMSGRSEFAVGLLVYALSLTRVPTTWEADQYRCPSRADILAVAGLHELEGKDIRVPVGGSATVDGPAR